MVRPTAPIHRAADSSQVWVSQMGNVDVDRALAILAVIEPELERAEDAEFDAHPDLSREAARDRALRTILSAMRVELSHETFVYLRWKADRAREAARATRERVELSRHQRQKIREAASQSTVEVPTRHVRMASGEEWVVTEVGALSLIGGPRFLLFVQGSNRWSARIYPVDWRSRTDEELLALLPDDLDLD